MPVQHNNLNLTQISRVPAYFSQLVLVAPGGGGLVHVNGSPLMSDTEDKLLTKLITSLKVTPIYTFSMTVGATANNQVYNPVTNTFNVQATKDPEALIGLAHSLYYGTDSHLVIELANPIQVVLPRATDHLTSTYDYQGQRANRQYMTKILAKARRSVAREVKQVFRDSRYTSMIYETYIRNRPAT